MAKLYLPRMCSCFTEYITIISDALDYLPIIELAMYVCMYVCVTCVR